MRDHGKLLAVAPLKKGPVWPPRLPHVRAKVSRHAVEQAVARVQPFADFLPEGERGEQRVKLLKLVIAQGLHRLIEQTRVRAPRRELLPERPLVIDLNAEPSRAQPRLRLDSGIGPARFLLL